MQKKNSKEKGIPIRWPDNSVTHLTPIKCGTGLLRKQTSQKEENNSVCAPKRESNL